MKQELEIIRGAVDNLETAILSAEEQVRALEQVRDGLLAEKADLEAKLAALQPKPEPALPDVPDVVINFGDRVLRPEGPGELWKWSGERRWFWDVTSDVRIILDAVGKQRRIILQRAWGDLPLTAPVATVRIGVTLGGETVWDSDVRIHHHTRPCLTFRRETRIDLSLDFWKKKARIPNLKTQKLAGAIPNRWEWKRWDQQPEAATANPWTERFGLASKSWVGGVPLSNEGSMISPWDATLLLSNPSPELWEMCADTADTIGNYAVHFISRVTGQPFEYNTEGGLALPQLNADALPSLTTAAGVRMPVADIAHDMALPNVMALLTGERFYIEALQSMVLLGSLAKKGADRASGIYWSGQVRSVAWWLRNLYHLCQATGGAQSEHLPQLSRNLTWMTNRFAVGIGSPEFRENGVLSWTPHKNSSWMRFAASPPGRTTSTGNAHFLAYVLGEIRRSGIVGNEAQVMLRHVLKAAKGTWEHSPDKRLASWLQHSGSGDSTETWQEIMKRTFASGPSRPVTTFPEPITTDIIAWHRAAVVAACDLGEAWAIEALPQIDAMLAADRRIPSIAWQVEPAIK